MSVPAIERLPQLGLENEQPFETEATLAYDLEHDYESRRMLMRVLGAVALDATVTSQEKQAANEASLATIAKDYFSDNPEKAASAKARLAMDFRKNVFEILCDEGQGHISESPSQYKEDGFYQYGYNQRAIFANGAQHAAHPVERDRRGIETLNEIRIEDGYRKGYTTDYYYVEISRKPASEEMTEQVATDLGYYHTARVMMRLTDVDAEGKRITETIAVSGVDENNERHDDRGVANIYQTLGLAVEEQTPTGILQAAFWVHKDVMPERSAGLARLYDEGLGADTFCGVPGKAGDYSSLVEESRIREKQVEEELDKRVRGLATELTVTDVDKQLKVMAEHAKDFAAELCSEHEEYSPAQFGAVAAVHITNTRMFIEQNNYEAARQSLKEAKETSVVSMCGMQFKAAKSGEAPTSSANADPSAESNSEGGGESSSSDECDFISKQCPICKKRNVKTTVTKTHIKGSCGCVKKK